MEERDIARPVDREAVEHEREREPGDLDLVTANPLGAQDPVVTPAPTLDDEGDQR